MNKLILSVLCLLSCFAAFAQSDEATITKVGDKVPSFSFEIEKGKTTKNRKL